MTSRAAFLMNVLETLGSPLVAASFGGKVPADPAQVTALLGASVRLSVLLAGILNAEGSSEESADALRLSLTGIAAKLTAGFYAQTGRVPEEQDLLRLSQSLDLVMNFADGLSAEAGHSDSAATLLEILAPVINAVSTYSFGRPEKKLLQDIAARLFEHAGKIRRAVNAPREDDIRILRALVPLYAGAHEAETARLLALSPDELFRMGESHQGLLPMDSVWQAFESRAGLMKILSESIAQMAMRADQNAQTSQEAA